MRSMPRFSALPIVVASLLFGALAHARDHSVATITISAAPGQDWQVTYRLPQPASKLVFVRSPDTSRTTTWRSTSEFEIVASTATDEIVQRRDGAKFAEVSLQVPPRYAVLPDDYGPFSPFGDGGMLFHTGRFFACGDLCPKVTTWVMRLNAPGWDQILLDGKRKNGKATWEDSGEGRHVYLGSTNAVETPDLIAIIDHALPPSMRAQLENDLPKFMSYYSARLGSLPRKPTLFVSYELTTPTGRPNGSGAQGGVLGGQIFMHFYGGKLQEKMQKPDFARELAWFMAHEAGHMYQRGREAPTEGAWIHEGSAEAFAAIALRAVDADNAAYVDSRIAKAQKECSAKLEGKSLHEAGRVPGNQVPYSCGVLLNLSIDAAARRAGNADGLFAVWRSYISRTEYRPGFPSPTGETDYLAAVGEVGGAAVADWVRRVVEVQGADLTRVEVQ